MSSQIQNIVNNEFNNWTFDADVDCRCRGWSFEKKHGLLLHSYVDESSSNDINKLPSLTAENVCSWYFHFKISNKNRLGIG